jgi:hypothetical protein
MPGVSVVGKEKVRQNGSILPDARPRGARQVARSLHTSRLDLVWGEVLMLREESLLKLNTAIRACLDRCYKADSPLVALASFVAELRRRPQWREAEIDEVESTVRRILQAVVTRRDDRRFNHAPRTPADRPSASGTCSR